MVTITDGNQMFRVTAGAVGPYKTAGFRVVSDEEAEEMTKAQQVEEEVIGGKEEQPVKPASEDFDDGAEEEGGDSEEEAYVTELLEKPLSQWSTDEMKKFVEIRGIDTSKATKASQVRQIIKEYMDEQNKNA